MIRILKFKNDDTKNEYKVREAGWYNVYKNDKQECCFKGLKDVIDFVEQDNNKDLNKIGLKSDIIEYNNKKIDIEY